MDISELWTLVLKMLVCFYLLLLLHMTEGCRLEGNGETTPITAYTGGSVLLPCSCTDLSIKPDTFIWEKYNGGWVKISESEQNRDRFQLVNDHSSGNLSLIISNLTEEDGGDYRCRLNEHQIRYIRLTVKGCVLNTETVYVTGNVGQSVLLPCSCFELQAKPRSFRWISQEPNYKEIYPMDETNHYTDRVQLFNDPPGNLSLLISHLTVEDRGWYRCEFSRTVFKDVLVRVTETTRKPSTSTPTIKTPSKPAVRIGQPKLVNNDETNANSEISDEANDEHTELTSLTDPEGTIIFISAGVVGVLLLLLIFGGVIYWKRRGQRQGETENGDGRTAQRTQPKKQDSTEPLRLTVTAEPTYEEVHKQNDSDVLYAAVNRQTEHKKAEEMDDVTYSTVVHSKTVKAAHTPVASGDTCVYASIKK